MKKILALGLAVFAGLSMSVFGLDKSIADNEKVEKVEAITSVSNTKGTKLYVVGDSTLSAFSDPYFYPRYGYGTKLQDYLEPKKIEVINLAMSGRSSKSFLIEKNYQTLKNNIKKGDYLIIGFGHNDEKSEPGRYSNPNGDKSVEGSFQNSLYENYVKLALDKKATPILCTPIVRRAPGKPYEGAVVHITTDVPGFPGGDYAQAVRDLGKDTGTIVVDLTQITKDRYVNLANDAETAKFHAQLSHKAGSTDNTHLNTYGASVVAYDVIKALGADKKFAKFIKKDIAAPTEDMLVKNPSYIIPKYSPFNPKEDASGNYKLPEPWYGSVFGDCGGSDSIGDTEQFEIEEANGVFALHAGKKDGSSSKGKIASGSDGIVFCFQKVSIKKDFTLKATVKVLNVTSNNQVSYGIMVRDDVLIDKYDNAEKADYVAAGAIKIAKGEGGWNSSFQRLDGSLVETKTTSETLPVAGVTADLSITKKGNVYTVKYGNDPAVEYTADLNEVDKDSVYAGMYVSRSAYVEFSNVSLTVE